VGMCQIGAIGMANAGKKYDEIIRHYYTNNVTLADVSPPLIFHTPIERTMLGSSVTIKADIIDSNTISSVKLFYKRYSESTYSFKNMLQISSTTYQEFIPANFAVAGGINYYIEAIDSGGNRATTAVYYIYVSTHIVGPDIQHTPQPYVLEKTFFTINCKVSDPDGVKNVILYYKNAIQTSFIQVNMQTSDGYNFSYTVEPFQVVVGEFNYYIVATDNYGYTSSYGSNTSPVRVVVVSSSTNDTSGPSILHTVISTFTPAGKSLTVSCKATDETGVKQVKLFYKNSLQENFNSVVMSYIGENKYIYTIQESDVVVGELKYYIVAEDLIGNFSYYRSAQDPVVIVVKSTTSIDTTIPKVIFEPITETYIGYPLEISLYAEDESGIESVIVYYRNTNENVYKQKKFTEIGSGYYTVSIPQEEINISVSQPSLSYFIIVSDKNNNCVLLPQNAPNETYKLVIIIPSKNDGGKKEDKIFVVKTYSAKIVIPSLTEQQKFNTKFTIYNLAGKKIKEMSFQNSLLNNSLPEISWDGKDDTNEMVPSGLYLYTIEVNNIVVKSGKIVVIR
ncbi:MAG: hypothetical protein N2Z73_03920, partial [Endomicrobia bacterium]|nr:hypothetical protein [Endomicrobiia bacterium]